MSTETTAKGISLYDELKTAGVPLANHESDLYAPDTEQVRAILARYPVKESNATRFINQAPPHVGERWIDIPFSYSPWWEARATKTTTAAPEKHTGRLYVEIDGDRYPRDVYICQDGAGDRVCTMNGGDERRMVAIAKQFVEAFNRNLSTMEGK